MKDGHPDPKSGGLGDSSSDSREKWIAIDRLCDAYEASLQDGQTQRAPFLAGVPWQWREQLSAEFDAIDQAYRDAEQTREDTRDSSDGPGASDPSGQGGPVPSRVAELRKLGSETVWLGRFEIKERLGTGATGSVWRARDARLARWVALKVPHINGVMSDTTAARFQTEARAAAALAHPNVVQVHEVLIEDGLPILIQQWIDGPSLATYLRDNHPMDFATVADWMIQISDAVACAHENGIVHRDLKPANVMLDRNRPMVLDFGLASYPEFASGLTSEGTVLGTPAYMSPEQAAGDNGSKPTSDVYALGAILYEMLVGTPPFVGKAKEVLQAVKATIPTSPRSRRAGIPRDLETIALRCLSKSPAGRYQSAAELRDDLGRFRDGQPIRARKIGTLEYAFAWCRLHPISTLTALAGIVIFCLSLGMTYFGFQKYLLSEQTEQLRIQQRRNERWRRDLVHHQNALLLAQASQEMRSGDRVRGREMLESVSVSLRGWEWNLLDRVSSSPHTRFPINAEHSRRGTEVTAVAWLKRKKLLFAAVGDGRILKWSVGAHADADQVSNDTIAIGPDRPKIVHDASSRVISMAANPNEQLLAWVDDQGTVTVWDLVADQMLCRRTRASRQPGRAITFLAHRKLVVGGGQSKTSTHPGNRLSWLALLRIDQADKIVRIDEKQWDDREAVTSLVATSKNDFFLARGENDASKTAYIEHWQIPEKALFRVSSFANGIGFRGLDYNPRKGLISWGDASGVFHVYDLAKKAIVFRDRASIEPLIQTRFSHDGDSLYVAAQDLRVTRWRLTDVAARTPLAQLTDDNDNDKTAASQEAVSKDDSENSDATKAGKQPVKNRMMEMRSARRESELVGHDQAITGLVLVPDQGTGQQSAVTTSIDGTVRKWSNDVDPAVDRLQLKQATLLDAKWIGKNQIALVTEPRTVLDTVTRKQHTTEHSGFVIDHRSILLAGEILPVTKCLRHLNHSESEDSKQPFNHAYLIRTHDRAVLFDSGHDGILRTFDVSEEDDQTITAGTAMSDRWLICASAHSHDPVIDELDVMPREVFLHAFDLLSGEKVESTVIADSGLIDCLNTSADHRILVGGTRSGTAFWTPVSADCALTDFTLDRPLTLWQTGHRGVRDLCWLGDQHRLATVGNDGMCAVWNFGSLANLPDGVVPPSTPPVLQWRTQVSSGAVTRIHASKSGTRLATVSEDRVIRIWDTSLGLELLSLRPRNAEVRSLRFSPGEDFLLIAESDGRVEIIRL